MNRDDLTRVMQLPMVGIVYDGRGGSLFIQSLLDDHPQVLTTPSLLLISFHDFFWPDSHDAVRRTMSADRILDEFVEKYQELFDSRTVRGQLMDLTTLGPARDQWISVPVEPFRETMRDCLDLSPGVPLTRRHFLRAVHVAYAVARGLDLSTRRLLLFPLHHSSPPYVHAFAEDHPGARLLVTTREPRQSYSSLHQYYSGKTSLQDPWKHALFIQPSVGSFLWQDLVRHAGGSHLEHPGLGDVRCLRLEDIHLDTDSTLHRLAAWLGIDFHPAMMESTINGKQLWFSMSATQTGPVTNFNPAIVKDRKWEKSYSAWDRWAIDALLDGRLEALGYERGAPGWPALALTFLTIGLPRRWEVLYLLALLDLEFHRELHARFVRHRGTLVSGLRHVLNRLRPTAPLRWQQPMLEDDSGPPASLAQRSLALLVHPAALAVILVTFLTAYIRRVFTMYRMSVRCAVGDEPRARPRI